MKNIDKYLTKTEKETSELLEVGNWSIGKALNLIIGIKDLYDLKKNGENPIVRILIEGKYIVKLQTYDNGTPYILVFDESQDSTLIKEGIKLLCINEELVFSEI